MYSLTDIGLLLLLVLGILSAVVSPCDEQTFVTDLQQRCRKPNNLMLQAEQMDPDLVCTYVIQLYDCTVPKRPECFEFLQKLMHKYWESPHECNRELDQSKITEWQAIVRQSLENKNSKDSPAPTPESLDETTQTGSAPQSWTHGQGGGVNSIGGGAKTHEDGVNTDGDHSKDTDGYHVKTDRDNHSKDSGTAREGTREEHTASDKDGSVQLASLSIWSVLLLVAMSRPLLWRLVS